MTSFRGLDSFRAALQQAGWVIHQTHGDTWNMCNWTAHNPHITHARPFCGSNDKPPVVMVYPCDRMEEWSPPSCEVVLYGNIPHTGMWCEYRLYSISPDEVMQSYDKIYETLARSWAAGCGVNDE